MGWGSIPACAGKPRSVTRSRSVARVHPRVCGEASLMNRSCQSIKGPSPRVRGSHAPSARSHRRRGSIPACAGKPRATRRTTRRSGVHPRVCGEAVDALDHADYLEGPSPRVRGSRLDYKQAQTIEGSIPACAGKPHQRRQPWAAQGVHPRVCGEARSSDASRPIASGPSPRVRGSHAAIDHTVGPYGSIPACAGKPVRKLAAGVRRWVHPRVCGEACGHNGGRADTGGPSPRVRGSREPPAEPLHKVGSIPACAGKPTGISTSPPTSRVHPRVCGEAPLSGSAMIAS